LVHDPGADAPANEAELDDAEERMALPPERDPERHDDQKANDDGRQPQAIDQR